MEKTTVTLNDVCEAAERIKNGDPYVIRFKSPGREDRKIVVQDLIKGKVVFPEYDLPTLA